MCCKPSAIGFELMLKIRKLGSHEDSESMSTHDRILLEVNARYLT